MNKQQKYLILAALTQTIVVAHAMKHDVVNQEDAKDKFALLTPALSPERINEFNCITQLILENQEPETVKNAYHAACALVADGNPLERDKALLSDRKFCRDEVKKHIPQEASIILADDLSGSDDESKQVTLAEAFQKVVKRVHARDNRLKKLALELQPVKTQLSSLANEEGKRNLSLGRLASQRNPLEIEKAQRETEAQAVRDLQVRNAETQKEVPVLQDWIMALVNTEPLYAPLDKALFVPPLAQKLEENARELDIQLARMVAMVAAVESKLVPLRQNEETLKEQQSANRALQAGLERKLQDLQKSQEHAQFERTKLFLALDQKLEKTTTQFAELSKEIAAIQSHANEQTAPIDKISIKTQLPPKEAALLELQSQISHLKVARAQADGTYTTAKWILGHYK